jgi:hypothetical protein
MDPNRDLTASCSNEIDDCRKAYNNYHDFIQANFHRDLIKNGLFNYEKALLIDIHGQSHPEGWIELGYLLTARELDTEMLADQSSIRQMASLKEHSFENLIRGEHIEYSITLFLFEKLIYVKF